MKVLIGQVALTRAPNMLQSVLGSCIGVSLYDSEERLGGLAHVLLPNSANHDCGKLPGKFADQAVPCLYRAMLKHGAARHRIKAKIAGGAKMFSKCMSSVTDTDIGSLNVKAVIEALKKLDIAIVSKDVGGNHGRKVEFDPATMNLHVEKLTMRSYKL